MDRSKMDGLQEIVVPDRSVNHLTINDVLTVIFKAIDIENVVLLDLSNNGIKGRLDWNLLAHFKNLRLCHLNGNQISNDHIVWELIPERLYRLDLSQYYRFRDCSYELIGLQLRFLSLNLSA